MIQITCVNLYTPILINFINNSSHLFNKYPNNNCLFSLPHHYKTPLLRKHSYQVPSKLFPYVWDSRHINCDEISLSYKTKQFKNIYILEPNFNQLKNCFVPLISIIHLFNKHKNLFDTIKINFLCSTNVKNSIISTINECCNNPIEIKKLITISDRFSIKELIIKK